MSRASDKRPDETNNEFCRRLASYIEPEVLLWKLIHQYRSEHGEDSEIDLIQRATAHGRGLSWAIRNRFYCVALDPESVKQGIKDLDEGRTYPLEDLMAYDDSNTQTSEGE